MNQLNSKMKFEELLTPYVQNRLDETQRQYVEELAKNDSELNEMLQFETQLANSIQQAEKESVDVAPSFDTLKQRIESTPDKFNWWNVFSWKNNDTLQGFNPSLVIASLAVVCIGAYVLITQEVGSPLQDSYETLSNGESNVVYEHDREYYRIVVKEELAGSKLKALANEFAFNIESGPDSLNSYIISLAADDTSLQANLRLWDNDPRFLFVEPLPGAISEY